MNDLVDELNKLKDSPVSNLINEKIKEFESIPARGMKRVFQELCFCLLTANFNAEKSIKIQEDIGDGFLTWPKEKIFSSLKKNGHRFPAARTEYIINARANARKVHEKIMEVINKKNILMERNLRDWLAKTIKGLGYKEASHFMRNIGFKNVAIIDFHILDLLEKHGLIVRPKTLTRKRYLEIEKTLEELGKKTNLNLAELDLYLWYMETGKVLK